MTWLANWICVAASTASKGAGIAHVDIAGQQHSLHQLGQDEQAQQVAGGRTRAADGLGGLLVRQAELVERAANAVRLFERIEGLRAGCSRSAP